jgi:hypothetical protein
LTLIAEFRNTTILLQIIEIQTKLEKCVLSSIVQNIHQNIKKYANFHLSKIEYSRSLYDQSSMKGYLTMAKKSTEAKKESKPKAAKAAKPAAEKPKAAKKSADKPKAPAKPKKKVEDDEEEDDDEDWELTDDDEDEEIEEDLDELQDEMLADEEEDEGRRTDDEIVKMLRDVECSSCPGSSSKFKCKVRNQYGCPPDKADK